LPKLVAVVYPSKAIDHFELAFDGADRNPVAAALPLNARLELFPLLRTGWRGGDQRLEFAVDLYVLGPVPSSLVLLSRVVLSSGGLRTIACLNARERRVIRRTRRRTVGERSVAGGEGILGARAPLNNQMRLTWFGLS